MASLRKKSGRYYARFYDKRRSPKRKELALGTSRKDVARRKLSKLERQYRNETFDPWAPNAEPDALTLSEAISRFMDSRSHLREETIKSYRSVLRVWKRTDAVSAALQLDGVNGSHLRPYVYSGDVKAATRGYRYRHLRTFFNWHVKQGHLEESPLDALDKPKKQKKLPEYLTPEQLERILRAIDADTDLKRADNQLRDGEVTWLKGVILLAVNTGMRIGELCALRWRDVDFENGMITCGAGPDLQTKSGHERAVPMTDEARDVLTQLRSEREGGGYVLRGVKGGKLNKTYASKQFKKYVRLAKLPERITFHSLRHTAASWMVQNGAPLPMVQAILGHSDASVTQKYAHHSPDALKHTMQETLKR
jgi:integrase